MVNWFDGLPFRIKTAKMAGAVPTIGHHFSEKELLKEKVGIFYPGACEVAQSLQARLAGSHRFQNRAPC